jgi:hypothetical protein
LTKPIPVPPHLQARIDAAKDIETTMLQLAEDLKYPVSQDNTVMVLNYLNVPDFFHVMAYHLTRCGYRRVEEKRLVKPRQVINGQFQDLVAWVPMDAPDEPIVVQRNPEPAPGWQVGSPKVNDVFEERSE